MPLGIIATMNHKGGAGKTATAAALATTAASSGYDTLCIDLDQQANLTTAFIPTFPDDNSELLDAMLNSKPLVAYDTRIPNLSIVPAGESLDRIDRYLAPEADRFQLLLEPLALSAEKPDIIIIDCPPGGGSLQSAALGLGPSIICPMGTDPNEINGLRKLVRLMLEQEPSEGTSFAELAGVLRFGWSKSTTVDNRIATEDILNLLDPWTVKPLLNTTIWEASSSATKLLRGGLVPGDVPKHWTNSAAALAKSYDDLWEEILELLDVNNKEDTP